MIDLPRNQSVLVQELPDYFHNSNVYVEVVGKGISKKLQHYSHSLSVQVVESYGQVRVTHRDTGRPLKNTYIKVYAKMNNGSGKAIASRSGLFIACQLLVLTCLLC